jgi:hypothetical protein
MEIDYPFSPECIDDYLSRFEQSSFQVDHRNPTHDRGMRFSSPLHEHGGLPLWLQFGEGNGSSLTLSQPSNPEEIKMLAYINFVYFLYAEYVNSGMEKKYGRSFAERWGLPVSKDHFDSLMSMVVNPENSNHGRHTDAKRGLTCDDDTAAIAADGRGSLREYSSFNLVVPTLAIQNHSVRSTSTTFFDGKSNIKVGEVTCKIVTLYWQLAGLQSNSEHEVSNTLLRCASPKRPNQNIH